MGKQKYEDAILQSISIITNQAIKKADYNKTIQATIIKCIDPTIEQYKIKYQDGYWYAYGSGSGVKYPEGSNVYILVPNGDMSQTKTILGTVQKLGINYVNPISEENKYEETGNNVVTSSSDEFGLCSYKKNGDNLSIYNEGGSGNKISINNSALRQYITTASHLCCSFDVRTDLKMEQRYKGKYGIRFYVVERDSTTTADAEITRTYLVDIDSMEGNPYNFPKAITQKVFIEINASLFKRISKVQLFAGGFPVETTSTKPNDIFISNISFQGMRLLSQEEMDTVALSFIAKKGYIFEENTTLTSLPIEAVVRAKGQVVNDTIQKVEYYWFVKNVGITASNPYYCKEGGQGWLCLNAYKKIGSNIEYNSGKKNFSVSINDVKVKKNIYKCVIIYGNSKFSKEFTIYNDNAKYVIQITSDKGTQFQTGLGKPKLTCTVLNNGKNVSSSFKFLWSITDQVGSSFSLDNVTTNSFTYDVNNIIGFNIFSCTVTDSNNNVIGSADITLVNKKTSDGGFSLVINNASQVFNYNEQGLSPCKNKTINYIIPQLSFVLYNKKGQEVDQSTIDKNNITWSNSSPSGIINSLSVQSNNKIAHFTISDYFKINVKEDNIKLEVIYAGYKISAKTNFTFTKEGYSGTNGTGVIARIIPNFNKNVRNSNYVPILYNNSNYTNFDSLTAQLWRNGVQITSGYTCAWSILKNKKDTQYIKLSKASGTTITVEKNGNIANYGASGYSNIVQVAIVYDLKTYYATLPIITADNSTNYYIYIKENTGYDEVLYSQDGLYPSYSNRPFQFVVRNKSNNNDVSSSAKFAYTYNNSLKNTNPSSTSKTYSVTQPTTYDGYNITSYVQCKALVGSQNLYINLPIYRHLNLYSHSALNGWNGNSLDIGDTDSSVILAPQVGAGSKDTKTNTFTGILMGTVKGNSGTKTGLFGYGSGVETIFLNSKNGEAIFGSIGKGQIKITPSKGTIESGNYVPGKTGMQIDLTASEIKFGSGNFAVNSAGHLTAKGGGSIAGWNIGTNSLSKGKVGLSSNDNSTSNKAFWAGNITPSSAPFSVDFNGKVIMTSCDIGNSVHIATNKIYSNDHSNYESATKGFYLGSNGLSLGPNFSVSDDGGLTAKKGYIGNGTSGFTIQSKAISNGKTSATDGNNGIWLGTDAIALGKNKAFHVSNAGAITAISGNIAGWNLYPGGFSSNGNKTYANGSGVPYTNGIFFGTAGIRLGANFHVNSNGDLYANNGVFVGKITTGSGSIAGWKINTDSLTGGNMKINSNGSMSGNKWSISSGGKATFADINVTGGNWKNGTISGGSRTGGSIRGGSINPKGVSVDGQNMDKWCRKLAVEQLHANQAYITKLVTNTIDSDYIKSKALEVGGRRASWKKIDVVTDVDLRVGHGYTSDGKQFVNSVTVSVPHKYGVYVLGF